MELQNSDPHSRPQKSGPDSPEPSCVSVKSNSSMIIDPFFSTEGTGTDPRPLRSGADSPEPSCVSVKSNSSMITGLIFSTEGTGTDPRPQKSGADAPEPSCVSVKSSSSMIIDPFFSTEGTGSDPSWRTDVKPLEQCRCGLCHHFLTNPVSIPCGHSFCKQCISNFWDQSAPSEDFPCPQCRKRFRTCPVLHPLKVSMEQDSNQFADNVLKRVLERHKTCVKNKYEILFEGVKTPENKTLLNSIFTQLYIIQGENEGVNEKHEVVHMEKIARKHLQDTPINCSDIFKPLQDPKRETEEENRAVTAKDLRYKEQKKERKYDKISKVPKIRTVLTKGIAGIGKTVSVQKFILDWAEGKVNQDVDFMFVLSFRELNLIKDKQCSLHELLCDFYPEFKDFNHRIYDMYKAMFIFDGLDESKILLNFLQCQKVSDITMKSSVRVLMTNLIKGDLLPSALIWITSRPAAANKIPPKHISRMTEIQGFSDPQKEEYFRKRISDEDQANKIISHIKTAKSIHIMCHIPIFCWISASVLQQIMKQHNTEIPKTLTEMYSHFLLTQINIKHEKYEEKDKRDPQDLLESNRTMLLKLAELAFKQLMKGNVMFYEEDLREIGIDVTEASVYSGIFTEIFREECVLYQRKVYCFIHLSFQEFLAAVYVFHCYGRKNMDELECFNPSDSEWSKIVPLEELLKAAVNKTLNSQNGHLDLFLRFLLGFSMETNQRLLQGLLTPTQSSSENTIVYIKKLINDEEYNFSIHRSINLFLCLSEMNDQSLSREIQDYLNSERHSEMWLSPGQCLAIAYMHLTSEEVLDELDLKKYNTSEEGYRRLVPAVSVCRKALLDGCYLTKNTCETLCSVLQSANSSLKELDLSNNDLQDSGMELLSIGLKSLHCKLETLRLAGCKLTTNSCEKLASALQSANSTLKHLDVSNNDLRDFGVKLLSDGLKSSHCKLETLRLTICNLGEKACEQLASSLQSLNSSLKELDLSNNDLQDLGVELLSVGLKSSHCKLEKLRLSGCMVTDKGCSSLASALKSNPSHLRELDLTYNHPTQSGVKLLSDLLEDSHSTLEKLQVEHGGQIRMKPGLKKYAYGLTLDPNTAHTLLSLSEGNKKVTRVREELPYPDHPDRFDGWSQVLCVESLTGRCYWEAEWSVGVGVSVSYRSINRKRRSNDCWFGNNNQSWSLECFTNGYSVKHNKKKTVIPEPPSRSNRVGVYLDWAAGMLSFYSISPNTHALTRLHTIHFTFTEPLYAGFRIDFGSSACVCVCVGE